MANHLDNVRRVGHRYLHQAIGAARFPRAVPVVLTAKIRPDSRSVRLYSKSDDNRGQPLSVHAPASPGRLHMVRAALRRRPTGAVIARTACFNVAAAAAAGLGGIAMARGVGPAVRGEYAAVTSWFSILLVVGEVGQSAAVCFYVARDPCHARSYVATSRTMMLFSGTAALACGLVVAPVLAHGNQVLVSAYRLIFAGSLVGFVGTSYTFSLQARSIRRWNLVRLTQPVLGLAGIGALWQLRMLTLHTAVLTLIVTTVIQLGYACYCCRRTGLAPGRFRRELV